MRRLAALLLLFAGPAFADELTAKKTADAVEITFGKEVVTTYHIGEKVAKPYFWPVNAPGAMPVTRAWPMAKGTAGETTDHVHQKSAWFCHGDVIPVGMELKVRSSDKRVEGVDFWSEGAGHGKMVCVEVGEVKPVSKTEVRIPTRNEWRTPDGVKMLPNDFVFALIGYHPDLEFLRQTGIEFDAETQRPRTNPQTLESDRPGVYLAGVLVAGMHTNEIFIENGRFHGARIAEDLAARPR